MLKFVFDLKSSKKYMSFNINFFSRVSKILFLSTKSILIPKYLLLLHRTYSSSGDN